MKKFLVLFSSLVFSVGFCFAQSSVTSGTVTDAGSVVWAYASVTATLSNPSGQTPVNIVTGQPVDTVQTATANAAGLFTVTVDRTDEIVPSGTSWNYVACSVAGVCAAVNTTVTTATKTIVFPAIPAVSVTGLQIPNANQSSQLAAPVGPSFGQIAIVGNTFFIYDVTTMTWIPVTSSTSAVIIAAISGATIQPGNITGAGNINITGAMSAHAGNLTSLVVTGNSQVQGTSSLGTKISNTAGIQVATAILPAISPGSFSTVVITLPVAEVGTTYVATGCNANDAINISTPTAITVNEVSKTASTVTVIASNLSINPSIAGTVSCTIVQN